MDIISPFLIIYYLCIHRAWSANDYPKVNCTATSNHTMDVVFESIHKDVHITCNDSKSILDIDRVMSCIGFQRVNLLVVDHCRVLKDWTRFPVFQHANSIAFKNIILDENFIFSDIFLEYLYLQNIVINELFFHDLPKLKYLTILNTSWHMVNHNTFRNTPKLMYISISDSQLMYLEEGIFCNLTKLSMLRLNGNKLQTIAPSTFIHLYNLEYLVLNDNNLTEIPPNLLENLTKLKHLFLIQNGINFIPESLLKSNPLLNTLDVSYNPNLKELPEGLLNSTIHLSVFLAEDCGLTSLPSTIFATCKQLNKVSLANNYLTAIHPHIFLNIPLTFLDLSTNFLKQLPNNLIQPYGSLTHLNLSSNELTRIPTNAFQNMYSLTTLDLHSNRIEIVSEKDFHHLTNLEWFDISYNKIQIFDTLGAAKSLLWVNITFNLIQEFPKISWDLHSLKILNLSYNIIDKVYMNDLPRGRILVDLEKNNISTFTVANNMDGYKSDAKLAINYNPFFCDCRIRNFVRFLQNSNNILDSESLTCDVPSHWKGRRLTEIIPAYHLCPTHQNCPDNCSCYQHYDMIVSVNCTSANLTHLPRILPLNTSIVHLENNSLSAFQPSDTEMWQTVTDLYLDSNKLDPSKPWIFPTTLKYLSIRNNSLTFLPLFLLENTSIMVDIRENPWNCNCSTLPFKSWFMDNLQNIVKPHKVLCSRFIHSNKSKVVEAIQFVPVDAFCQPENSSPTIKIIIISVAMSIISFTLIFIIVFYFHNKRTILAFLYSHYPSLFCFKISDLDEHKAFDAFVSYTSSDRDAVMSIINELEEKHPYFKFCIHERDWLPGYPISYQIEQSVQNSRKTILILSKEFLNSFWCETEFELAYLQSLEDKIDRIIIIIKGELPPRDTMPIDLINLLSTKTYLEWGERWFWEKLRYALPHYSSSKRCGTSDEMLISVDGMICKILSNKDNNCST